MSDARTILRELRAVGAIRGREHLRGTLGSKPGENLAFSEDARHEHLREHLRERLREGLGSKPRENLASCEDAHLGNDERLPRNPQESLLSFNQPRFISPRRCSRRRSRGQLRGTPGFLRLRRLSIVEGAHVSRGDLEARIHAPAPGGAGPKYKAAFATAYGAGLRVSENKPHRPLFHRTSLPAGAWDPSRLVAGIPYQTAPPRRATVVADDGQPHGSSRRGPQHDG
jgi:hypothetical protein